MAMPIDLINSIHKIGYVLQTEQGIFKLIPSTSFSTGAAKDMNNKDYLKEFVGWLKDNDKSQNTIDSYTRDLKQFFEFYTKSITEIGKEDVREFKEYLKSKQLNIKSINRKLVSLKQFVDFLNDRFNAGITVKIRPEKQQKQDYLEEMLTKEEYEKMVKAAEKAGDLRAKAIFATLYYTGMRVSEMLQMQVDDIEKDRIEVKGKGSKYRYVFIPKKLKPILRAYANVREDRHDTLFKPLFTGQRGPINRQTVHNIIKQYARAAGIKESKAHAHSFRHLFCLRLAEMGMDIDTIADLAGHSDINITRIYTRKTTQQLQDAINDL